MHSHYYIALYTPSLTAQQELAALDDSDLDWDLAKNPHLHPDLWQRLYSKYSNTRAGEARYKLLSQNILKSLHKNPRNQLQLQLLITNPNLSVAATAIEHALPIASDSFITELVSDPSLPPDFAAAALASGLSFLEPVASSLLENIAGSDLKTRATELYCSALICSASDPLSTPLPTAVRLLTTLEHGYDVDFKLSKALDIRPELLPALLSAGDALHSLPIWSLTLRAAALSRHLTAEQGEFILSASLTITGAHGGPESIKIATATRLAKNPNLTIQTRLSAVTQVLGSARFNDERGDSIDNARERRSLDELTQELRALRTAGATPVTLPWQDAMGDLRVQRALKDFSLSAYPTLARAHYDFFPDQYSTKPDISAQLDSLGQGAWKIYLESQDTWEGSEAELLALITTLTP